MKEELLQKITSTGVVEQAIESDNGTRYVIRFTGEKNRSFLVKTAPYTGDTKKYEEGKLVHIRYWFDKKGNPGAEIIDPALTPVPDKANVKPYFIAGALAVIAAVIFWLIV